MCWQPISFFNSRQVDAPTKRVTRFARGRGDDDLMDDLTDPDKIGYMDDPRAMRRWAKGVGKEMGEDLGDDFDEYMDAAESGEMEDDAPGGLQ